MWNTMHAANPLGLVQAWRSDLITDMKRYGWSQSIGHIDMAYEGKSWVVALYGKKQGGYRNQSGQ
jgi:hypothetical protein